MIDERDQKVVVIGYYPIRAKAQPCRLLCEFLQIKYRDQFFCPKSEKQFWEKAGKDWIYKDLPFLIDEDFHLTGTFPICQYLAQRAGRVDMLGKTIQDQIIIDQIRSKHDIRTALLGLTCLNNRSECQPQQKKCKYFYWNKTIYPQLLVYQTTCKPDNWFLGYISLLDVFFYELLGILQMMFPQQMGKFPKLMANRQRFGQLPQIAAYENSNKAVLEACPVKFFSQFKDKIKQELSMKCGKIKHGKEEE